MGMEVIPMQKKPSFFVAVALTALLAGPAQAAFQMRQTSTRASGMGNSFLAAAGEPAAVFTNPAGIASLRTPELSFLYHKPFAGLPGVDLSAGHAAFALPVRGGSLGFGYALFQGDSLVSEQTLAVSYGFKVQAFQLGVGAKQLSHGYNVHNDPLAHEDPVFANGTSKSALAFDAGAIVRLGQLLKLGLAMRNINEPNVGLASEDTVPREIQTGLMLNMAGLGLKATGDIIFRSAAAGEAKQAPVPFLGLEKSFKNALALRLGANTEEFTGGFGVKVRNIGFDYALVLNKNLMDDNAGSHKLGMTYKFSSRRK